MTTPHRLIAGLLLLGASAAHAGSKVIFTGPVPVGAGQFVSCRATNTSADKPLTGVQITMRRPGGTLFASTFCSTVEPLATCGNASSSSPGPGSVSCEVTSDKGAKLLRATLVNEVTGASSDAR